MRKTEGDIRSRKKKNLFKRAIFELMESKDREALQKMSVEESIKIMEDLLDSGIVEECQKAKKQLKAKRIE